ncbi:hypothetical protein [Paenibacillus hamazuiensis]|uniref:hypothetical protein n=1 Tax=Paenibacillus hamazuiensis TaxID=2936508 RepID=UPI00200C550B|nr:hypothetical protein [Paenibacillus hamazuiensis]
MPVAELVFGVVDPAFHLSALVQEGAAVRKGTMVAEMVGSARSILLGERLALNLKQRLSGIAARKQCLAKINVCLLYREQTEETNMFFLFNGVFSNSLLSKYRNQAGGCWGIFR